MEWWSDAGATAGGVPAHVFLTDVRNHPSPSIGMVDLLGRRVGGYFNGLGGKGVLVRGTTKAVFRPFQRKMCQFHGILWILRIIELRPTV